MSHYEIVDIRDIKNGDIIVTKTGYSATVVSDEPFIKQNDPCIIEIDYCTTIPVNNIKHVLRFKNESFSMEDVMNNLKTASIENGVSLDEMTGTLIAKMFKHKGCYHVNGNKFGHFINIELGDE